jgi:hypothetical protein
LRLGGLAAGWSSGWALAAAPSSVSMASPPCRLPLPAAAPPWHSPLPSTSRLLSALTPLPAPLLSARSL